jgi:hypothetical protein
LPPPQKQKGIAPKLTQLKSGPQVAQCDDVRFGPTQTFRGAEAASELLTGEARVRCGPYLSS